MIAALIGFAAIANAIVVNKLILQELPLFFYVGLRALLAGSILYLYARRATHRFSREYLKVDLRALLFVAVLTTLLPALLKAFAIKYMFASKAALIGSLDPFVTAIYAYTLFGDRLNKGKILGIIVAFSGALGLCFATAPGEQSLHAFLCFSLPELAAFASVALSRLGWLAAQRLLKKERYSPIELNAITMICSGLLGLGMAAFLEDGKSYAALCSLPLLAKITYSVLVGNVFGYTAYGYVLKRYSANFASLIGFSTPIFVTIFGWMLLGEAVSGAVALAGAVIFTGVFLFYREELKA
jgi:drug/metabolite transporter (DMT)-like permease